MLPWATSSQRMQPPSNPGRFTTTRTTSGPMAEHALVFSCQLVDPAKCCDQELPRSPPRIKGFARHALTVYGSGTARAIRFEHASAASLHFVCSCHRGCASHTDDVVRVDPFLPAVETQVAYILGNDRVLHRQVGRLVNEDLGGTSGGLQARRHVDTVTHHRIVHTAFGADIAGDDVS